MRPSSPHFFPLATPLLLALFLALVLLIAFIEIGFIGYAYEKIGIDRRYVFSLLMLSLLGSYVNIPVTELPAEQVMSDRDVHRGRRHVRRHLPDGDTGGTPGMTPARGFDH